MSGAGTSGPGGLSTAESSTKRTTDTAGQATTATDVRFDQNANSQERSPPLLTVETYVGMETRRLDAQRFEILPAGPSGVPDYKDRNG